jgi:hypothetical protein
MVRIWAFRWFIFNPAGEVLTTEVRIGLYGVLVVQPFTLDITFTLICNIHEFEGGSLPEIVATIDQFINSTVEPTFKL